MLSPALLERVGERGGAGHGGSPGGEEAAVVAIYEKVLTAGRKRDFREAVGPAAVKIAEPEAGVSVRRGQVGNPTAVCARIILEAGSHADGVHRVGQVA